MDLFEGAAKIEAEARAPLAERMRPRTLPDFLGQKHLTAEGRLLRKAIESGQVLSMIFWGPPGTGKTTLARLVAQATRAHFEAISAVLSGVKELREAVSAAEERWKMNRSRSILFVDEIHRFNKGQQDALLPHVEKGTLILLGATTENPSFEVNAALLSRVRVLALRPLEEEELRALLNRALADPRGLGGKVTVDGDAMTCMALMAGGDARKALTTLEVAAIYGGGHVDRRCVEEAVQQQTLVYDKGGEEHFNVVSAFIKSMRASDPDAAVYWLARMVEAGEDPRFIVRRMVIFASEDVGNADPLGLQVAVSTQKAVELLGFPEAVYPLTQAVTYLAMAPKSNSSLMTYSKARQVVLRHGALPVPIRLRHTSGQSSAHSEGHLLGDSCLPEGLRGERLFEPGANGFEGQHRQRIDELRALRAPREPGEDG